MPLCVATLIAHFASFILKKFVEYLSHSLTRSHAQLPLTSRSVFALCLFACLVFALSHCPAVSVCNMRCVLPARREQHEQLQLQVGCTVYLVLLHAATYIDFLISLVSSRWAGDGEAACVGAHFAGRKEGIQSQLSWP